LEVTGISFRDVHGIADELGVDVQTVRRWIQSGRLRAFKPGKEYRVREGDLEEFLAAREVRPKAQAEPQRPSLDQVRDTFAPLADGLNHYCARWEEKLPSLQGTAEEVEDFFLDFQDFHAVIMRTLENELYAVAEALDLGSRYGNKSGLPRDMAVGFIRAEAEEHSLMHEALGRYGAIGRALAESVRDEDKALRMRQTLTEVGV
jgi:excisionase family DNA binding protein